MKKPSHQDPEMKAEYDFASMKRGVRGKYVKRFRQQTNIVVLEPEVAEAFPNEAAVNLALRGVLDTARAVRGTGGLSDKNLHTPGKRKKA